MSRQGTDSFYGTESILPRWLGGEEPVGQCKRHKRRGVRSLGREDAPEEGMATHSNSLAWSIL